uniref:CDT1 Geminin-binding domain-containing protein n=1 Tax=Panagrolaimus sp. PS1159 TaxID=55785 RepID=A0AC35FCC8_9BILA
MNENSEKNSMRSNLSLQTVSYESLAKYENSMESCIDTFGKSKKGNLNEKEINLSSNISFKFPKQQENDELKVPEIAQFKASENLHNPYKLITTIEDESKITAESENECK